MQVQRNGLEKASLGLVTQSHLPMPTERDAVVFISCWYLGTQRSTKSQCALCWECVLLVYG